ncbi:hypothetical protein CC80DRAFT_498810 [Byssothecium circinans]|uniref:Uncharacterized protein n=1 Tax=Byssothecium circinans TaxID=147558 RepID=A0A6A5URG5_9PLEO|nr:hypothetical protein CC80DRAFT_498810 [Byssothecium circinans]
MPIQVLDVLYILKTLCRLACIDIGQVCDGGAGETTSWSLTPLIWRVRTNQKIGEYEAHVRRRIETASGRKKNIGKRQGKTQRRSPDGEGVEREKVVDDAASAPSAASGSSERILRCLLDSCAVWRWRMEHSRTPQETRMVWHWSDRSGCELRSTVVTSVLAAAQGPLTRPRRVNVQTLTGARCPHVRLAHNDWRELFVCQTRTGVRITPARTRSFPLPGVRPITDRTFSHRRYLPSHLPRRRPEAAVQCLRNPSALPPSNAYLRRHRPEAEPDGLRVTPEPPSLRPALSTPPTANSHRDRDRDNHHAASALPLPARTARSIPSRISLRSLLPCTLLRRAPATRRPTDDLFTTSPCLLRRCDIFRSVSERAHRLATARPASFYLVNFPDRRVTRTVAFAAPKHLSDPPTTLTSTALHRTAHHSVQSAEKHVVIMESERPHLSITLPRNFMFHYQDGQLPRTPEPEPQPDELVPPPPPRQMLKVRRRRCTFVPAYDINELSDPAASEPVPTIEGPELHSDVSMHLPTLQPSLDSEYLSPALTFGRMISPPKTPVAQMGSLSNYDEPQHWAGKDYASQSETSSRPTSSGGFSDSSISSRGSFGSFPSMGGSCSSPEEEMVDPFEFCPIQNYPQLNSPMAPHQPRPPKKLKLRATFTEEMDYHLWVTYMKYLQDPTVTPFKALPSTVPPNGVCHRVARLARRTWKGGRPASVISKMRSASRYGSRNGTPDTIKPTKSGSSTPIPGANKPYARHPDEKSTRKRLRYLARQKPTLSAHYQRLLHRSPSPFQSSPEEPVSIRHGGLSSPFSHGVSSFSTRDMNVSLTTSTAASMQLGNPLSQLASDIAPQPAEDRASLRTSAHQKSQSLHIGLGLGLSNSFQTMSQMTDVSMNQHNAQTWPAPSAQPARLGSPLQLHAPRPISRPFKRRALHNFEEQVRNRGNSFIDQVFGAPAQSSHRRVRSRGFSLGDMVEGARRLPLSTSGPPEFNPFANVSTPAMASPPQTSPAAAQVQGQATVRLGSPFGGRPSNTFPRASMSYSFEPPAFASFEERLAGLPHY